MRASPVVNLQLILPPLPSRCCCQASTSAFCPMLRHVHPALAHKRPAEQKPVRYPAPLVLVVLSLSGLPGSIGRGVRVSRSNCFGTSSIHTKGRRGSSGSWP